MAGRINIAIEWAGGRKLDLRQLQTIKINEWGPQNKHSKILGGGGGGKMNKKETCLVFNQKHNFSTKMVS